jgi:hypothetical protein
VQDQNKLSIWFAKPYPSPQQVRDKILTALFFGVFVFVFLIFFQPFGISDYQGAKAIYVLGFATITTTVMLITHLLLPKLLPGFFDAENWTIAKAIVLGLWILTAITLLNYIFWSLGAGNLLSFSSFLAFAVITPSVGIFPIMFIVFINELYLSDKHARAASRINSRIQSEQQPQSDPAVRITLRGAAQGDVLDLDENDLLFIRSQDNYAEVHFNKAGETRSRLLRISLKELEEQLQQATSMYRCHRSFLVNRNRVARISGNARAYTLHLDVDDLEIPVSRSRAKDYFA